MVLETADPDATRSAEAGGRRPVFSRVVLKLSGEALLGDSAFGIDMATVRLIAQQIEQVVAHGVQLAIIVGGGNIVRGLEISRQGIDRVTGDYMGMLATVINALSLRDAIEHRGMQCRVQSAIAMQQVAEPFIPLRAVRHLEKGRVVIFAGGTGNPYFSTDTAAVLRALEIEAQILLKGTNVDGIYTADPRKDPKAKFIPEVSFQDAIVQGLGVMDANAFGLCKDNALPIQVFNINQPGAVLRILKGDRIGTLVR